MKNKFIRTIGTILSLLFFVAISSEAKQNPSRISAHDMYTVKHNGAWHQEGSISLYKGIHKVMVYQKIPATKAIKLSCHFKGLELIPVNQ